MNQRRIFLWALARLVLSAMQIAGATALAVCLYRFGSGPETMVVLSITLAVTVLSILLFRVLRVQENGKP